MQAAVVTKEKWVINLFFNFYQQNGYNPLKWKDTIQVQIGIPT